MKTIQLGLLGLGTVGSGVASILSRNQTEIQRRIGHPLHIAVAGVRDASKRRSGPAADLITTTDLNAVVTHPEVDIVVELMGGVDEAYDWVMRAINAGKHVVTANKALIAHRGNELFAAAEKKGVMIAYEAAVAGGIPIIKALREGLAANRIQWLAGIINGTSNFILSEMFEHNREFAEVLEEAQALGYAEADPEFDVEGIDVAHKLTILASIAFGIPLKFDQVYIEGITQIGAKDMRYAEQLGYRIKPLGIATRQAQGYQLRVYPALIPEKSVLSHVNGAMNAVLVQGDAVGSTLYYGAGAGGEETGSAVVADIIDVVRDMTMAPRDRLPALAYQPDRLVAPEFQAMAELKVAYYLRLQVKNQAGILAAITQIFGEKSISIEAFLQKEHAEINGYVSVVVVTYEVLECNMNAALAALKALPGVHEEVVRLRLEPLDIQ